MKKMKVALIGAGNIANTHLDAYMKNDRVEVYAICDIDEERLKITADKYNIERRYTDINELLKLKELDAADVCVWNCSHASCAIAALNAGLHVMCEKPMAYNAQEAEEMLAAAEKNNKLLMIGFVMRFSDESRIAKDFIDNGTLGDIYYSKATYLRRHGNPGGWFSDRKRSGGGPVIDLGVHVIDHTRYLMGSPNPVSVYAATFEKLGNRKNLKTTPEWVPLGADPEKDVCDVEDLAMALIRYDNGAVTLLETSYSLNGEPTTKKELYGTKGGISLAGNPKIYTELNDYMVDVTPDISRLKSSEGMFDAEINHFVSCVLDGTPCNATAEDGIVVMKILDAIYESARTGHEVTIK